MLSLPVLHVNGETIAEGYENALVALYENGVRLATQYDKKGDPLSLDATLNLTVANPLADPMIHKAFPGGIDDLKEYVMEVRGAKDHWVKNINDPEDTRWEYTYHGRLAAYGDWREVHDGVSQSAGMFSIDQIDAVINKLSEQPFTRRAQMITWMPNLDLTCYDPPCLQSLWYRMMEDESGTYWLQCNVRFRSNDAWGAHFMNMFGFTVFNKDVIAHGVAEKTGKDVQLGRLNWHADSYHIYGKDIEQAEQRMFLRRDKTTFEERTFCLSDPIIREIYDNADEQIQKKIADYDAQHSHA